MASQQQNQDTYGIPDPNDLLSQQQEEYAQNMRNPNLMGRAITSAVGGLQNAAGGGPQMMQAQAVSARMKSIMADVSQSDNPDEDPLTRQLRMAKAMSTGLADVSPKAAAAANAQTVQIQQAQTQQRLLNSRTDQEQTLAEEGQLKLAQGKTNANYVVFDAGAGKDGIPSMKPFGEPISMYGSDGKLDPEFNQKLAKAMADAKAQGMQSPMYLQSDAYSNGKGTVADTRAKVQIDDTNAKIQAKAAASNATDPSVIAMNAGDYLLHGMAALARLPPEERDATRMFAAAHGLNPMDGIQAQAEIKQMNAAATATGRREGNVEFLAASVPKLGDNVLSTLDGVTRTRFPMINAGIIAGKDFSGDPGERAYSAAIQGYVNEYARVISGGTGVTSDEARRQANDLIRKADNPDAVKASLKILSGKELDAIKGAGPIAAELLRNPQNYPVSTKIMGALGMGHLTSLGADPNVQQLPPSQAQRPGQGSSGGNVQPPHGMNSHSASGKPMHWVTDHYEYD
jgi:hypothetical protein